MFFKDPFGNALEFKSFKQDSEILISSILSSPITLQDFHAKALTDYGINDLWPEAVLKEAKTKR